MAARQVYVFNAQLDGWPGVRRTVAIRSDQTLVDLHYVLKEAFECGDDHLFAFWPGGEFWPARALRAYAGWAAGREAWAFLNAIKPEASWSRARWFWSFLDQRMRIARLRLSQEWQASTTQRRARQPGVRSLAAISSPRVRMWGVNPCSVASVCIGGAS